MTVDPIKALMTKAANEPVGVDVSDYSDEWVLGFLRGQASILYELDREPERYGVGLVPMGGRDEGSTDNADD